MRKDTSSLVHEPSGEASAGADPLTEEALARRRAELAKIELRAKAAEEKAQRHHEAEQRLAAEIKRHVAFLARIGSAEGEAPEQIEAAETLMAALSDAMIALHGFEHAPIPQAVRRWAMAQQMSGQMADAITAARALLATLTLDGALVTGDAIHAQAETAQLVLDRGGDYLFALKANRPAVQREVAAFFADPPEVLETFATTDADHGRVETRRHRVTHCVDWLFGARAEPGAPRMPGLATLACVAAERIEGDRTTRATRFYLSSARLAPERFARAVRAHWAIENSLHWILDVTFDEDAARNRADNGPENLAILRRLTLNLLRSARPKLPVSRKRKRSGWSDDFARTIIGQMR